MQGHREEATGGVYADIRRGLPMTENPADGPLSLTALSKYFSQTMTWERVAARKNKDWAKADELRDRIAELGYGVQDTPQGPVLIPLKGA